MQTGRPDACRGLFSAPGHSASRQCVQGCLHCMRGPPQAACTRRSRELACADHGQRSVCRPEQACTPASTNGRVGAESQAGRPARVRLHAWRAVRARTVVLGSFALASCRGRCRVRLMPSSNSRMMLPPWWPLACTAACSLLRVMLSCSISAWGCTHERGQAAASAQPA